MYLGPVNRAEKLAAAERFDTESVARALAARGLRAESFPSNAALLEKLIADTLPAKPASAPVAPAAAQPRVVVFFSNGSFDGIIAKYAAQAT